MKAQRTGESDGGELFVGFDVGSSCVHCVALTPNGQIAYSAPPLMHFANPLGAIREAWLSVLAQFGIDRIRCTAFTGSGAEPFRTVMTGATYVFDSVAIPKGAEVIEPHVEHIVHIGAKDSYFFSLRQMHGHRTIQEWKTGTKCGGGSGTLIEKQCRRLFEGEIPNPPLEDPAAARDVQEREALAARNRSKLQGRLEKMFAQAQKEAEQSVEPSEFLARCGVVIQSDLIHKQNEGATRRDNLAGLFRTVARNFRIDVLGTREIATSRPENTVIATGGVLTNDLIRRDLEQFLGIALRRPEHHHNVAALGAAVKGMEENSTFVLQLDDLEKVAACSREKRQFAPPLRESLAQVREASETLAAEVRPGTEVVLGIDGGSTTTKGVLVEVATARLLDKLYIKTHGNPEESLKQVLRYLSRHKDKVIIKAVGATGSARKLYERMLISKRKRDELKKKGVEVVDRITDEITCHALGVRHYDPQIDTIFEVGGQDMKFTSFAADGTVKEAKMNYSCQAGSGQTMENMADILDLNVENTLQEAALRAERVPIIDSTCGVFMEMDENRLIAEGFGRDEIAAAIVRGTAASYYFKFVGGSEHAGRKCSAQGGPALGKAFLAALAQVTGRRIDAYPHREMFGAWGQALDIIQNMKELEAQGRKWKSAFRGWELMDMPFEKRTVSCRELFKDKSCGIRDCQLEVFSIEDDEIITGGFCPRGNSEAARTPRTNYVDRYHKIYEKHFRQYGVLLEDAASARSAGTMHGTVGIKRSTATLGEKGIWSAALFRRLGFCPVVSPRTNKEIAKLGVDNSRTEFCIARKLATGHAAVLTRSGHVDYLFNPSFIEHRTETAPDLKYCIYTESEGYILNDVLSLDKNKQINPILHFGDRPLLIQAIRTEFARLGLRFTKGQIRDAIASADEAEAKFTQELYAEGDEFLQKIERSGEKAYVGIGRDYVLLDPEASSNSGVLFSQIRGLHYIPQPFLEHRFADIALDDMVENEFWEQSVKILKASLFVAAHPKLFAIRMMNFACGPDSFKIYQEEKIQRAAHKPILSLLTDGQTNNAPFVTRTEAHERVVDQSRPAPVDKAQLQRQAPDNSEGRVWLIPYMGDCSYVGAAGLRHFQIDSRVLPTNTKRGYELARRHIHTEVCHPLKCVVGDALAYLLEETEKKGKDYVDQNYLIMLPTTSGPCRFGKYPELVREFLDREGFDKVPVVGPSARTDYNDLPLPRGFTRSDKMKMQRILFKGIKAAALLEDTLLRFRPYAVNKSDAQQLKTDRLRALESVMEKGGQVPDLIAWGRETVTRFQALPLRTEKRFPLVLYIGEIYMRQHDPATAYVVERLEEHGLEIIRDPVTEWLEYINGKRRRDARRDLGLRVSNLEAGASLTVAKKYLKYVVKGKYMSSVDEKLAGPFHEILEGRHVLPGPIEIIEALERQHEYHGSIEGESPLSIGIAYHVMRELIKQGHGTQIAGVFHVGPFTCMQEGVATAKMEAMIKEFRKAKEDLLFPIVHAFFGDSPNPNLDAEIAVFTEQCYQKSNMLAAERNPTEPPHSRKTVTDRSIVPAGSGPGSARRAAVSEVSRTPDR